MYKLILILSLLSPVLLGCVREEHKVLEAQSCFVVDAQKEEVKELVKELEVFAETSMLKADMSSPSNFPYRNSEGEVVLNVGGYMGNIGAIVSAFNSNNEFINEFNEFMTVKLSNKFVVKVCHEVEAVKPPTIFSTKN